METICNRRRRNGTLLEYKFQSSWRTFSLGHQLSSRDWKKATWLSNVTGSHVKIFSICLKWVKFWKKKRIAKFQSVSNGKKIFRNSTSFLKNGAETAFWALLLTSTNTKHFIFASIPRSTSSIFHFFSTSEVVDMSDAKYSPLGKLSAIQQMQVKRLSKCKYILLENHLGWYWVRNWKWNSKIKSQKLATIFGFKRKQCKYS